MKINLSDLEEKASAATQGERIISNVDAGNGRNISVGTCAEHIRISTPTWVGSGYSGRITDKQRDADAEFIASMNPQTALALIRIAKEAKILRMYCLGTDCSTQNMIKRFDEALEVIE